MTQKEFRTAVYNALAGHAWFTGKGVRVLYLDGSTASTEALEGDLRASPYAVLCVSYVLAGGIVDSAGRGKAVKRKVDVAVLVRVNPTVSGAPDVDDCCDEVIKAVSGCQTGAGQEPILYKSQSLVQDSVFSQQIIFTSTVFTA